jgi:hypothetical protein
MLFIVQPELVAQFCNPSYWEAGKNMGWFEGTWASRPQHSANLGPHFEPLEACLGVGKLPFDAQGPASIPGVIKAQHSQTMFSILHTLMK